MKTNHYTLNRKCSKQRIIDSRYTKYCRGVYIYMCVWLYLSKSIYCILVCTCMYVHLYCISPNVYYFCTYTCHHVHRFKVNSEVRVCPQMHVHIQAQTCMHIILYIYIYIYTYIFIYTYIYILYILIILYIYTYTCYLFGHRNVYMTYFSCLVRKPSGYVVSSTLQGMLTIL